MTTHVSPDLSRIVVLPGQRSGQPFIRSLRVTVWDVLDMLASGMSESEFWRISTTLSKLIFQPYMPTLRSWAENVPLFDTSV